MSYKGLFKGAYNLKGAGSNWIRLLSPEDRQVLVNIGLAAAEYGRQGGRARAATATRNELGKFTKRIK